VPKAGKGTPASSAEETREGVSEYYGETLQSTADLKTAACLSTAERPSREVRRALGRVHDEIHQRYYGCGLVVPEVLEGCRALDLGCGAGRDVFVLAQMVSEKGSVIGVDMTAAQLDVARKHIDYHTEAFGYARSNVKFVQGTLEELDVALGMERVTLTSPSGERG
jgi:2-polyprenyl-3-methyl-5-hydroxy-6-metoxy-1,4-benzoquinol methylase